VVVVGVVVVDTNAPMVRHPFHMEALLLLLLLLSIRMEDTATISITFKLR